MEKVELTFKELKERLHRYDELSLIELLEITSEELIDRFEDKIEEHYEKLIEEEDF